MRYCAKCGEFLNDNTSYCSRCGAKVDDVTVFCPRCGEELTSEERYCHRCGYAINGTSDSDEDITTSNSMGHPFLTSLLLFAFIAVVVFLIIKFTGTPLGVEDEHVTFVKNGCPTAYPDITYEEAFSNFFSNRNWRYFESDTGEDIVEFTGDCVYRDAAVTVCLQFILDTDEGTFETGYLAFNDVPQSLLIEYALITKVFESY